MPEGSRVIDVDRKKDVNGSLSTHIDSEEGSLNLDKDKTDQKLASKADYDKKRIRRQLVCQEIYETEKGYVNDLTNLVRNFLDPLNSAYLASVSSAAAKTDVTDASDIVQNTTFGNESKGWITFDQKQAIVRNGTALLRVQKLFSKMLEDAVLTNAPPGSGGTAIGPSSIEEDAAPLDEVTASLVNQVAFEPSVLMIARAFKTMMPKMETVYLTYCSNHDYAMETWTQVRDQNPNQSQRFLDECLLKMNTRMELQDFLIKPVQRICKYPLLINELLKSTPPNTEDHLELSECLDKIKDVVTAINEKKRLSENQRKRDTFLQKLFCNSGNGIYQLGLLFGFEVEAEAKSIPLGQKWGDKIGVILKAGGLQILEYEDQDISDMSPLKLKPSTATGQSTDVSYYGFFVFQAFGLVIWPKKLNQFHIVHVIPFSDVRSIKESPADTKDESARLRHAWKLTWETLGTHNNYLRTIQMGAKSDKERNVWIDQLDRLLPEGIVVRAPSSHTTGISSPVIINAHRKRSEDIILKEKQPAHTEESSNFMEIPLKDQVVIDMKMSDSYTADTVATIITRSPSLTSEKLNMPTAPVVRLFMTQSPSLLNQTASLNRVVRKNDEFGLRKSPSRGQKLNSVLGTLAGSLSVSNVGNNDSVSIESDDKTKSSLIGMAKHYMMKRNSSSNLTNISTASSEGDNDEASMYKRRDSDAYSLATKDDGRRGSWFGKLKLSSSKRDLDNMSIKNKSLVSSTNFEVDSNENQSRTSKILSSLGLGRKNSQRNQDARQAVENFDTNSITQMTIIAFQSDVNDLNQNTSVPKTSECESYSESKPQSQSFITTNVSNEFPKFQMDNLSEIVSIERQQDYSVFKESDRSTSIISTDVTDVGENDLSVQINEEFNNVAQQDHSESKESDMKTYNSVKAVENDVYNQNQELHSNADNVDRSTELKLISDITPGGEIIVDEVSNMNPDESLHIEQSSNVILSDVEQVDIAENIKERNSVEPQDISKAPIHNGNSGSIGFSIESVPKASDSQLKINSGEVGIADVLSINLTQTVQVNSGFLNAEESLAKNTSSADDFQAAFKPLNISSDEADNTTSTLLISKTADEQIFQPRPPPRPESDNSEPFGKPSLTRRPDIRKMRRKKNSASETAETEPETKPLQTAPAAKTEEESVNLLRYSYTKSPSPQNEPSRDFKRPNSPPANTHDNYLLALYPVYPESLNKEPLRLNITGSQNAIKTNSFVKSLSLDPSTPSPEASSFIITSTVITPTSPELQSPSGSIESSHSSYRDPTNVAVKITSQNFAPNPPGSKSNHVLRNRASRAVNVSQFG